MQDIPRLKWHRYKDIQGKCYYEDHDGLYSIEKHTADTEGQVMRWFVFINDGAPCLDACQYLDDAKFAAESHYFNIKKESV